MNSNLLIALIDAGKLANQNWNEGHYVVIYAQNNNNFILHDPGLPSYQAWIADKNKFMEAFRGELIVIPKGNIPFGQNIGLNDPCWCGLEKKFKKCGMLNTQEHQQNVVKK